MASNEAFDVIVIGAGSAGENAAGRTAAAGLRTAIVENELVGGECSYWACMPSKALLRPMAVLNAAKRVAGAAGALGEIDPHAVLQTRDETVNHYQDDSQVKWVKDQGIELLRGTARLNGPKRVVVTNDGESTTYDVGTAVVIATGSHAVMPAIPGLSDVDPWDSRGATSAKTIPRSLAVIGGGVVAVEMAQAYKSLGADVTVLVRGDRLIENQETFASDELLNSFMDDGIDVRLSVEAKLVHRLENGFAEISRSDGSTIEVERVLVAAGRKAATEALGVETLGLSPGKFVAVDDRLCSTEVDGGWLYAVGDVNGRSLLTHMGKYQARIVGDAITGKSIEDLADHDMVPAVIFTDPQIASVGKRLAQAQEEGMAIRELKVGLDSVAGAFVNGKLKGTAQLVVDETRHVIIGATFTGPEVGEMLHAATVAIVGEVPLERLWHAVPSYPTVSEVWLRLLEQYGY